jgi:hypothetical protein
VQALRRLLLQATPLLLLPLLPLLLLPLLLLQAAAPPPLLLLLLLQPLRRRHLLELLLPRQRRPPLLRVWWRTSHQPGLRQFEGAPSRGSMGRRAKRRRAAQALQMPLRVRWWADARPLPPSTRYSA